MRWEFYRSRGVWRLVQGDRALRDGCGGLTRREDTGFGPKV